MAKYLLQNYQSRMAKYLSGGKSMTNFIELLNKLYECEQYDDFDSYVLWMLWRGVMRKTDWEMFYDIELNFPNYNDLHILTLLKNSFKEVYGKLPSELITIKK